MSYIVFPPVDRSMILTAEEYVRRRLRQGKELAAQRLARELADAAREATAIEPKGRRKRPGSHGKRGVPQTRERPPFHDAGMLGGQLLTCGRCRMRFAATRRILNAKVCPVCGEKDVLRYFMWERDYEDWQPIGQPEMSVQANFDVVRYIDAERLDEALRFQASCGVSNW